MWVALFHAISGTLATISLIIQTKQIIKSIKTYSGRH
jgi:hypothetical protein